MRPPTAPALRSAVLRGTSEAVDPWTAQPSVRCSAAVGAEPQCQEDRQRDTGDEEREPPHQELGRYAPAGIEAGDARKQQGAALTAIADQAHAQDIDRIAPFTTVPDTAVVSHQQGQSRETIKSQEQQGRHFREAQRQVEPPGREQHRQGGEHGGADDLDPQQGLDTVHTLCWLGRVVSLSLWSAGWLEQFGHASRLDSDR